MIAGLSLHPSISPRAEGREERDNAPRISRILLESESQNCNLLPRDRVEEGSDDALRETTLLVLVELDDLVPVLCDFGEVEGFGEVDEVEDVFLEASLGVSWVSNGSRL